MRETPDQLDQGPARWSREYLNSYHIHAHGFPKRTTGQKVLAAVGFSMMGLGVLFFLGHIFGTISSYYRNPPHSITELDPYVLVISAVVAVIGYFLAAASEPSHGGNRHER